MAKIQITESKLTQLINESINEVLAESLEDEGIARALGQGYQWLKNRFNRMKGDWNAGRNIQRYKDKDYDPYHGYDNANDMRNFGGQAYGAYRYDKTAERNANATQYPTEPTRKPAAQGAAAKQNIQGGPSNFPDLAQQQGAQQPQSTQGAASPETYQNPRANAKRNSLGELISYMEKEGAKRLGQYDASIIIKALQMYQKNTGMQESKNVVKINETQIRDLVAECLKKALK